MNTGYFSSMSSTEKDTNRSTVSSKSCVSRNFIPIVCHYDENTLITKNGELLQTIEILGINSEHISDELFNLRKLVRKSIKDHVVIPHVAFWIHTIRRQSNLDDDKPYNSYFSANIHNMWRNKNYWHDKFVNNLYLTIVYDSAITKINNFSSFVNSFFPDTMIKFEENYLKDACLKLTEVTDNIIDSLSEFGVQRLKVRLKNGEYYSNLIDFYHRIINFDKGYGYLDVSDLSDVLSSHQYIVGSNVMELHSKNNKKFIAVMSIKEYHDVSTESIDRFLRTPVEMVATEVFYFADRSEVIPEYQNQEYILRLSKDEQLRSIKGLDKIFGADANKNGYCFQQISFSIIADSNKLGIVVVREDIDLEKVFWSHLPSNFTFLTRLQPTTIDNIAALASLHNCPVGNKYNPWGKAVTLLRTEKGTPYFNSFHDNSGNSFTAFFGRE